MSPAEIEEAVKGLNREELAKLAGYIPALRATRAHFREVRSSSRSESAASTRDACATQTNAVSPNES